MKRRIIRLAHAMHQLAVTLGDNETEDWNDLSKEQKQEYKDLATVLLGVWDAMSS